jgi:hypothetical protein
VVLSRIRRHERVFRAGHDHTYHRLVARGLDNTRAVAVMHIAAVGLGCLGFIALNLAPLYANALFFAACLLGLGFLIWLDNSNQ